MVWVNCLRVSDCLFFLACISMSCFDILLKVVLITDPSGSFQVHPYLYAYYNQHFANETVIR